MHIIVEIEVFVENVEHFKVVLNKNFDNDKIIVIDSNDGKRMVKSESWFVLTILLKRTNLTIVVNEKSDVCLSIFKVGFLSVHNIVVQDSTETFMNLVINLGELWSLVLINVDGIIRISSFIVVDFLIRT